jgi:hypothetical protein
MRFVENPVDESGKCKNNQDGKGIRPSCRSHRKPQSSPHPKHWQGGLANSTSLPPIRIACLTVQELGKGFFQTMPEISSAEDDCSEKNRPFENDGFSMIGRNHGLLLISNWANRQKEYGVVHDMLSRGGTWVWINHPLEPGVRLNSC